MTPHKPRPTRSLVRNVHPGWKTMADLPPAEDEEDIDWEERARRYRITLAAIAKGDRHVLGAKRKFTAPELREMARDALDD